MNIHTGLHRLNTWIGKKYNFISDFIFFRSLGYGWKKSWAKARDTL